MEKISEKVDHDFLAEVHAQPAVAVLARLRVESDCGLMAAEVARRRAAYGPNELAAQPPVALWRRMLAQFQDLVIWILLAAALISGALGEWVDTITILAIVVLNGGIGFLQEERAERALAALQQLSAPIAKVFRTGVLQHVPARELVPGDVIELEAGDHIPADARLLEAYVLGAQEAALTGESLPVEKDATQILAVETQLGDRRNMLYQGTVAATGKARAVVTATGMQTELGRIAGMLKHHDPEPTPLQRRLTELGRVLIVICLGIVAVIFALQVLRSGRLLEALLVSVSLAVAAVPEGLPAVVTIALALGLQRMVRRNVLVRRLPSVETLGSVTVICSDKTGTLTRNEMTVQQIVTSNREYEVTGSGYTPRGQFLLRRNADAAQAQDAEVGQPINPGQDGDLLTMLTIGAWCNNARLLPKGDGGSEWMVIGDPTEGCLLVAALKAGIEAQGNSRSITYEIPFDSTRKTMSVAVRQPGEGLVLYTKGAPEMVLAKCSRERVNGAIVPLAEERRRALLVKNAEMAGHALRVLGLAYRPDPPAGATDQAETDLILAGFVGMIDPPREEAKQAIATCREAGIQPVMITGDHPGTALAIGRQLGLVGDRDRVLAGPELDALSDAELSEQVDRIPVFARATAQHKLRIVKAWRARGQVVAMTGDGVNDAPAVKAADIGIAMGITGTDVTKEASDMVLTDDNFASIVNAVEEGRGIYDNIQKVLAFLLSCNCGEILLMLVATLLGWPAPLLPIQLLWINLVTDGLPALALSLEPPEPDVMRRRPRRPDTSILSPAIGVSVIVQGALIGLAGLLAFGLSLQSHPGDVERARAVTFCVVVYAELLRALSARSRHLTLFQLGLSTNPYLLLAITVSAMLQVSVAVFPPTQRIFDVPLHSSGEWLAIAGLAFMPFLTIELTKACGLWRLGESTRGALTPPRDKWFGLSV